MEFITYFDPQLKNRQITNAAFDCQAKPAELASMIHCNWYAVRVRGGKTMINPNYFKG